MPISGYTPQWNAGIVEALGSNLTLTGGTLSASGGGGSGEWNAGTVNAIGGALVITSGTLTDGGTPPPFLVKFEGTLSNAHVAISNGGLTAGAAGVGGDFWYMALTNTAQTAGDYYFEFVLNDNAVAGDPGSAAVGICASSYNVADGTYLGTTGNPDKGFGYYPGNGAVYNAGGAGSGTVVFPTASPGDTISVAYSIPFSKFYVRVNGGAWGPSGNPVVHTGGYDWSNCGLSGSESWVIAACFGYDGLGQITANFGHTAFTYPSPAGYIAPGT
jgi:hypothetical protein